jgi:hypothetical protein
MGGMIAIVSKEWWPAIIDTERDSSSGLGLMGRIKFKTDSVPITAICATYLTNLRARTQYGHVYLPYSKIAQNVLLLASILKP